MSDTQKKIITTTTDKTEVVAQLTASVEKLKQLLTTYEEKINGDKIADITNPRHTLQFIDQLNAGVAALMGATPIPSIKVAWSGAAHDHWSFSMQRYLEQMVKMMKRKGVCPEKPPAPFKDWLDFIMYMPEYLIEGTALGVMAMWPGGRDLKESITFERTRVMYPDPKKPGKPQLFDMYDREIPMLEDTTPMQIPVGKQEEEPALA